MWRLITAKPKLTVSGDPPFTLSDAAVEEAMARSAANPAPGTPTRALAATPPAALLMSTFSVVRDNLAPDKFFEKVAVESFIRMRAREKKE